jgi:hypothetical protein
MAGAMLVQSRLSMRAGLAEVPSLAAAAVEQQQQQQQ